VLPSVPSWSVPTRSQQQYHYTFGAQLNPPELRVHFLHQWKRAATLEAFGCDLCLKALESVTEGAAARPFASEFLHQNLLRREILEHFPFHVDGSSVDALALTNSGTTGFVRIACAGKWLRAQRLRGGACSIAKWLLPAGRSIISAQKA